LSIPAVRDYVTKELLLKIEAQLPNVAASSLGLRALRDRLTIQISEAKALRSRFPDSFLHRRVSVPLTKPCPERLFAIPLSRHGASALRSPTNKEAMKPFHRCRTWILEPKPEFLRALHKLFER
jgi:hypothetical protein